MDKAELDKAIYVALQVVELEHTFSSQIPVVLAKAVLALSREVRTVGTIERCSLCRWYKSSWTEECPGVAGRPCPIRSQPSSIVG